MHAIVSRNLQKRAEVTATEEGIRLDLYGGESRSPYFSGYLHQMLTCSEGKPWRFKETRLENVEITGDADRIGIRGTRRELGFRMELSFDRHGPLSMDAAWDNDSERTLEDAAFGLLFAFPRHSREIVTIPHMIYNNNPSSDPERIVPRLGAGPDRGFICEEHRLPIPCVNLEWTEEGGTRFFSLFAVPSFEETADGTVHYGSLGAVQEEHRFMAAAMSGVLMFNGEKDIHCVAKSKTAPYGGGYRNLPPGSSLRKQYALDWGTAARPGQGFREIVRKGMELFAPEGARPLTAGEMIRLKTNALDDRWRTNERGAAGYVKFTDSNAFGNVSKHPLHYMYGWTGQCLKLAWCDAKLGFGQGRKSG
ncbi:hypothetical protein LJK88_17110 [Paenibacillus sp. P26]|nr:hypothetical protein LJK88_17110 [Paenibacillus sp. P26]